MDLLRLMKSADRTKVDILYIHSVPLPGPSGQEGRFSVTHASGIKGPIESMEVTGPELADWVFAREAPRVHTLYHHTRKWAFQGILDGQQMRKTMLASPHICSPTEFNDRHGIAIGRMRQCALQPACGGWRQYMGVDKQVHEMLLYNKGQLTYTKQNPLYKRYEFLSPQMTLSGFVGFVQLVGSPRWFATDTCPTCDSM